METNCKSILQVPGLFLTLFETDVDWAFQVRAENCCKFSGPNNTCYSAAGKMLGGSSAMNGMVYVLGAKANYDLWADMGCPGWDYADELPYFKKYEGNTNASLVAYDNGFNTTPLPCGYKSAD